MDADTRRKFPTLPSYPDPSEAVADEAEKLFRMGRDKLIPPGNEWDRFIRTHCSKEFLEYWEECKKVRKTLKKMGYSYD